MEAVASASTTGRGAHAKFVKAPTSQQNAVCVVDVYGICSFVLPHSDRVAMTELVSKPQGQEKNRIDMTTAAETCGTSSAAASSSATTNTTADRRLFEHQRQRSRCKSCGGVGICEHQRVRTHCKSGSGICLHQRQRGSCKDCKGTGICEHIRQRGSCKVCTDSSLRKQPKAAHEADNQVISSLVLPHSDLMAKTEHQMEKVTMTQGHATNQIVTQTTPANASNATAKTTAGVAANSMARIKDTSNLPDVLSSSTRADAEGIHLHAHSQTLCRLTHAHTHIYTHSHMHTRTHARMHACMQTHKHTNTHPPTHTH